MKEGGSVLAMECVGQGEWGRGDVSAGAGEGGEQGRSTRGGSSRVTQHETNPASLAVCHVSLLLTPPST